MKVNGFSVVDCTFDDDIKTFNLDGSTCGGVFIRAVKTNDLSWMVGFGDDIAMCDDEDVQFFRIDDLKKIISTLEGE